MAKGERVRRRTYGILCAAVSVLVLLSFVLLLKGDAGGASAAPLLFVGVGLLVAAFRSFRTNRLG